MRFGIFRSTAIDCYVADLRPAQACDHPHHDQIHTCTHLSSHFSLRDCFAAQLFHKASRDTSLTMPTSKGEPHPCASRQAKADGNPQVSAEEQVGQPSWKVWSLYLGEADKQDKMLTENWKGDTDGILIFVSNSVAGHTRTAPIHSSTDRPFLRHGCRLHHRKLQEPSTRQ